MTRVSSCIYSTDICNWFSRCDRASVDNNKIAELPRFITYYLLSLITIGVAIVILAPEVLVIIATPKYIFAEKIIPWLILGMLFQVLYTVPMNILTQLIGKTKGIALVTFAASVINITLNILLVPKFGILAAAVNTTIGYTALFILMLIKANRNIRLEYEYARIGKALFLAIMLVGVSYAISYDDVLIKVAAAGVNFRLSQQQIIDLVRDAGFTPARRTTTYTTLEEY